MMKSGFVLALCVRTGVPAENPGQVLVGVQLSSGVDYRNLRNANAMDDH